MRGPRLQVWQMMVGVVLVAALLFTEKTRRRWLVCQEQIDRYTHNYKWLEPDVWLLESQLKDHKQRLLSKHLPSHLPEWERDADWYNSYIDNRKKESEKEIPKVQQKIRDARKVLDYYSDMRAIWEEAAGHPWNKRTGPFPPPPPGAE
jgi:hypothetical protein